MERIRFNEIKDLAKYMYDMADKAGNISCAVLLYDDASEIIKELLLCPDIEIGGIDFEQEDYNGYDKEYYITIDSDLIVDVCKARRDDGIYLGTEADIAFFGGNVSSKTIKKIEAKEQYEVVIGDFDDRCGECCNDCSDCEYKNFYDLFNYIIDHLN